MWRGALVRAVSALIFLAALTGGISSPAQESAKPDAPSVKKVEPPNWWIGLTSGLMVLLSGHGLEATRVACNLPEVVVERTQAKQGGEYLFVWLKFGPGLRSGTAVRQPGKSDRDPGRRGLCARSPRISAPLRRT